MRKIGFIGMYDKMDMIMYVSKILTTLGKKILIVDATIEQKARYIVPAINPTFKYITEYEKMDIAVGFANMNEIMQYTGVNDEKEMEYDIALINVNTSEGMMNFKLQEAEKKYFVTSFDVYSLKKGLEAFKDLPSAITLTKVLFSKDMIKEEDEYLNFLSREYKIVWNENLMYFPFETEDLSAIYENQRVEKIKFKKLSIQYKEGLTYLTSEILGDINETRVRRTIKTIEKGV